MLTVTRNLSIPNGDLEFSFVRSSGPGGQNVNKLNTKAVLRFKAKASLSLAGSLRDRFLSRYGRRLTEEGELIITSQRTRSQAQNQADCLEKLRQLLLAVALPPKRRRPTRPTAGSKVRRRAEKEHRSKTKQGRGRLGME